MNCPRCKKPMVAQTIRDIRFSVNVDYCESCGGRWFDNGELTRMEKTVEPALIEIRKIPDSLDQLEMLECPSCSNHPRLQKMAHEKDKHVIIDFCPVCNGIWLDKGELEAIQKENWLITIGRVFRWLTTAD